MNDQTIDHEKTKDTAPVGRTALVIQDSSSFQNLMDTSRFEQIQRVANAYSCSGMVPENYQGNVAACIIAIQMAMRLDIDPMMFMQNTFILHGKPGMFSTLVIALVNKSGPFNGPIQFELTGEGTGRQCRAFATHAKTRELCEMTVSIAMAKAEGWFDKKGSKWQTIPDLMLRYRSAAWLARVYAPECIMGMQTADELQDADDSPYVGPEKAKVVNPQPEAPPPTEAAEPPAEEEEPKPVEDEPEQEVLAPEPEPVDDEPETPAESDEPEAETELEPETENPEPEEKPKGLQAMYEELKATILSFDENHDEFAVWAEVVDPNIEEIAKTSPGSAQELKDMITDKYQKLKDAAQ